MPFSHPNPPHLHFVPPRSPAARPVRPTRPDWRARHICGQDAASLADVAASVCCISAALKDRRLTLLPDSTSDACAEGVSHRDVARLATHCSLYIRPLTGHPHAVGLMHSTPSLRCMLHCPFPTNPPRLHSVPPRSPAARPVRPARPDWRARHMRAECQLSQPRPPRWCTWVRSVRVRSCSARLRRGGTSSLP